MRIVNRLQQKTESSLQLVYNSFSKDGKFYFGILIIDVLSELCNSLGISLCFEFEAFTLKESLEFLIIGDDTIVYNRELPCRV